MKSHSELWLCDSIMWLKKIYIYIYIYIYSKMFDSAESYVPILPPSIVKVIHLFTHSHIHSRNTYLGLTMF